MQATPPGRVPTHDRKVLRVRLYWGGRTTRSVHVRVVAALDDEVLALQVADRSRALDVFDHPFACAA